MGGGLEASVIKALRRENITRLAPTGKNMVSINFQIDGVKPTDMAPPPPVSNEYVSLGEVNILAAGPKTKLKMPPFMVVPASENKTDDNAAAAEKQYPEPTVVQVKVADNKRN